MTSVFEVFLVEGIFFFFNLKKKKKKWNIGIGENTCHHVTHVTHSKIVINTRYEKEVFKNGKVKPKRYTRLCAAKPKQSIAKTIKKNSNNTKRSIIYVKSKKKTRIS